MTLLIILLFVIGYMAIATEHILKVDKAAIALLLGAICWALYILSADVYLPIMHPEAVIHDDISEMRQFVSEDIFLFHVGDTCEIILFLMGAMTIVELVDAHGGFNFVNRRLTTRSSQKLLWLMSLVTFFLSAVLDNLTTSIVMIMILRKLVAKHSQRILYASVVIIAANAGGAFSPIGDITTIMLWIKGNITSSGVITHLFLPSIVSLLVPTLIVSYMVKGQILAPTIDEYAEHTPQLPHHQKLAICIIGVGGLVSVPLFHSITSLPPFMGVLGVLGILWVVTEVIYRKNKDIETPYQHRVTAILHRIDITTILFFLGILLAVAALQETGVLAELGKILDDKLHNVYLVNIIIGIVSSFVDNVPLVASAIGMYPVPDAAAIAQSATPAYLANFMVDGTFWELLAYCAGTGGSILIIGSAAGVVVMGLEKIDFMWYLKHFSIIALAGYLAGVGAYWLQLMLLT